MHTNTGGDDLFSLYKKVYRRKQLLFNALNLIYTFLLIPLIKILDGTDYSMLWRAVAVATDAALIVKNIKQSISMKRQLSALTENTAEQISAELESCERFRNKFFFTSGHLFSTEGMIIPYYEIKEIVTKTYGGSPTATNIIFKTRSFGSCVITIGYGYMNESFYNMLSQKCPTAEISFRVNYQKADMEEYFATVRAESINVIRKKRGGN